MAAGDVFECTLIMTQNGEKLVNRFHVQDPTGVSNPENAIFAALNSHMIPVYASVCSQDLHFVEMLVRRVYPTKGGSWVFNVTQTGTFAYPALPPQSVAILSMRSGTVSVMGRGRIHVSGIPQTMSSDGLLLGSYIALLGSLAVIFSAPIVGFNVGNWNSLGGPFHPWLYFHIPPYAHTLRSRRFVFA